MGNKRYEGLTDAKGWTGKTFWHPEALKAFSTKTPTEFFVVSMGDMFAKGVSATKIVKIGEAIYENKQHKYMILTKRYSRMADHLDEASSEFPNLWPGFSVCDQKDLNRARPDIKRMTWEGWPLWLSCEPLLGPIDLKGLPVAGVVCGGESGPGARPMHPDWARSLRDQCAEMGVPFMFKQWGAWAPNCLCGRPKPCKTTPRPMPGFPRGVPGVMFRCGKNHSGRKLYNKATGKHETHDALPWRAT
jgi:protein gp37